MLVSRFGSNFISPVRDTTLLPAGSVFFLTTSSSDVKYIWNNSYLNRGRRWKWRVTIARLSAGFEPVTSAIPILLQAQPKRTSWWLNLVASRHELLKWDPICDLHPEARRRACLTFFSWDSYHYLIYLRESDRNFFLFVTEWHSTSFVQNAKKLRNALLQNVTLKLYLLG